MIKTPAVRGLLAGFVLLIGNAPSFAQTPPPGQMLDPKLAPKHEDAVMTTPSAEEIKKCKVELVKGSTAGSSGWKLSDGNGRPLRQFFDSNGDGKVDVWSYFKDGVETYREIDTTYKNGRPNNFRWLNHGGMKWGTGSVDPNGRAAIDYWRMISAEEVGYEAFQAVARGDFERLRILFISDTDLQSIKLSQKSLAQIAANQKTARQNFAQLRGRINLANAKFERVEGFQPSCVLQDGENFVIKYPNRPVLYELNKKHDWLHTGELIQTGMAWRLVDVPSDKEPNPTGGGGPDGPDPTRKDLQKLYEAITALDGKTPPLPGVLVKDAVADSYLRKRIAIVQQLIQHDDPKQQETWYKQLFDNMTSMAQNSGADADINLLKQHKDFIIGKMAGSNLAGYGAYRHMWTGYAIAIAKETDPKKIAVIQDKWLDQLSEFVKKYPRAEDTGEALHQLAIGCEFGGKDEEAKRWYSQLYENFADHNLAPRAKGSVARLNLPGRALQLTSPQLHDPNKLFDIAQLRGKIVVVHYWASYSNSWQDDFVRLKRIMDQVAQKHGVELVCINLDDRADIAKESAKSYQGAAYHLYQAPSNNSGGLNGPLGVQYGIHMLPTIFMVGRDGRVTNRALQIGDIETELKKVQ